MSTYTIKDLEKLSGVKSHTIRIWEKRYSLIEPSRTETNRRVYSDYELRKVINVGLLTRNGIKISHVARLSSKELEEKVAEMVWDNYLNDDFIEAMVATMLEFNEKALRSFLKRLIENDGFEETFENIVFPFLKRVGSLWQSGSANPAQEHFITVIIRNIVISEIEAIGLRDETGKKRVLLFLPDNELHELGLLYYAYLVRKRGHEMIYLGQMMPLDSLPGIAEKWKPDLIITGTVSLSMDRSAESYVTALSEIFRGRKVLVAGLLADAATSMGLKNILPLKKSSELIRFL